MTTKIALLTLTPTHDQRLNVTAWGIPPVPRPGAARLIVNQRPPDDAGEHDTQQFFREARPGVYTLVDTEDAAEREGVEVVAMARGFTGIRWVEIGEGVRTLTVDLPEKLRPAVEAYSKAQAAMQQARGELAAAMRPHAIGPAAVGAGLDACPSCHTAFRFTLPTGNVPPIAGDPVECGACGLGLTIDQEGRITRPRAVPPTKPVATARFVEELP